MFAKAALKSDAVNELKASALMAEEKVDQSWGTFLPAFNFDASYQKQDLPSGILTDTNFTTAKVSVSQPLFRGFREFSELSRLKSDWNAAKLDYQWAKTALYEEVATAYYQQLNAEKSLENLHAEVELMKSRVSELTARVRIGRSRKGELLSSQVQLSSLVADLDSTESKVVEARLESERILGENDLPRLASPVGMPPAPQPLAHYLETLKRRDDLVAESFRVRSADEAISTAKGHHLPTIDLTGNYYIYRTGGLFSTSRWDIGVALSIPIFQGGVFQSRIREAAANRERAEIRLSLKNKQAEQSLKTLHSKLLSQLGQWSSLEESLRLAELNYKENSRDYQLGLVTNLEVMTALNAEYTTKRLFDRTRLDTWMTSALLNARSGNFR